MAVDGTMAEQARTAYAKMAAVLDADGKTLAVGEGTSLQRAELDAAGRALAMLDCDSLDNNEPVSG